MQWIMIKPEWWEWDPKTPNATLYCTPDFSISKTFIITECYLMNHRWLSIVQATGSNIFDWLNKIEYSSYLYTAMLYKTIKIWFAKAPRKPPDKVKLQPSKFKRDTYQVYDSIMTFIATILYGIEDTLYVLFGIICDVNYWAYFSGSMIKEFILDSFSTILAVDFHTIKASDNVHLWNKQFNQKIATCIMNKSNPNYFRYGKLVTSNMVMSLSAKSKKGTMDDTLLMDTDSYNFAIDTCTSESICRHKELFIGETKPCKNIYIQGVAGKVKVTGYGTIKLRITDDNGQLHDMIIHNVLYVPESAINLLSPQRWSQGDDNSNETGEITVGNATLLFWNDRQSTKLIPHQPEMGIPIMSVNDGFTKSAAFFMAAKANDNLFCLPCTTQDYVQTSQTIMNPMNNNEMHIIPVDDDDIKVQDIAPPFQNKYVDELNQRQRSFKFQDVNIIKDDKNADHARFRHRIRLISSHT